MLTTKARHKSFVKHVFEEPTTKLHLIANGLTPDQISKCFNLAFSITAETKLTMFQYKTLHDVVFTKSRLFKAKLATRKTEKVTVTFYVQRYTKDDFPVDVSLQALMNS